MREGDEAGTQRGWALREQGMGAKNKVNVDVTAWGG
jgi:hypothetical protein